MIALKFPFQLDLQGHIATVDTYPEVVRGQLIDVVMTNWNERVMRPQYGANMEGALFDPTEELVRADAASQVMDRIREYAPRVTMRSVEFTSDNARSGQIVVDVLYSAGAFDEARSLRLPVSWFMSQETPI